MKRLMMYLFNKSGYKIIRNNSYEKIIKFEKYYKLFELIKEFENKNIINIFNSAEYFNSQFGQDLFVLYQTDFKENGFFVEFGAANGIELSNTYILEKKFGWKGILSEPALKWHSELLKNRNSSISKNCVWKTSNELIKFSEVNVGELSTISEFKKLDNIDRDKNIEYEVETISLKDLLIKFNAPRIIDYLSIDTEGSEFEILSNFDFESYKISIITVEHNYTNQREKLYNLLTQKGYVRVYEELSKNDDWYILN